MLIDREGKAMDAERWHVGCTHMGRPVAVMLAAAMMTLSACIQVNAPDRPIEIVLNINIRQEVVYRLDQDAKELIEQNTEIF